MKAIETKYKNHFFRSRLEARWAGGIALYATQELNNVVIKPWEG
jgi:hypothetical protein